MLIKTIKYCRNTITITCAFEQPNFARIRVSGDGCRPLFNAFISAFRCKWNWEGEKYEHADAPFVMYRGIDEQERIRFERYFRQTCREIGMRPARQRKTR